MTPGPDENKHVPQSVDRPIQDNPVDHFRAPGRPSVIDKFWVDEDRFNMSCTVRIAKSAGEGLFLGFFASAALLAWYPDGLLYSHKGVVVPHLERLNDWGWAPRQMMRPMTICAVISSVFAGVECMMENARGAPGMESPWWNTGTAGLVAGAMAGGLRGRIDVMCVTGAVTGALMTAAAFSQNSEMNRRRWAEEGRFPVSTVTEETYKEMYPEYKDL